MTGFLFALLAVFLAGIGARDQVLLAGITARHGPRGVLLVVALTTGIAASAFAAWGAVAIAPMLNSSARMLLAAMALGLAGLEALVLRPPRAPAEPTHSLGAAAIVLLAHQLTDSARFLIFAIALATAAPIPAGMGGAAGSIGALVAGWLGGSDLLRPELSTARRVTGGVLLLVALFVGMRAFGLV